MIVHLGCVQTCNNDRRQRFHASIDRPSVDRPPVARANQSTGYFRAVRPPEFSIHAKGDTMKLTVPSQGVFAASAVLFGLALVGFLVPLTTLSLYVVWLAFAAYIVLAAGVLLKNL
jgi:hypothetical protein